MGRANASSALADRLEPARERVSAATAEARERARVGAEIARDRATEVADRLEPAAHDASEAAGRLARRAVSAASTLPDVLGRVLEVLSRLLSSLAEQGREVAAQIEPPKKHKRRSRLRTAAWFGGGFVAGAATGWVLHARTTRDEPDLFYEEVGPAAAVDTGTYDDRAAAIDARRTDTPVA